MTIRLGALAALLLLSGCSASDNSADNAAPRRAAEIVAELAASDDEDLQRNSARDADRPSSRSLEATRKPARAELASSRTPPRGNVTRDWFAGSWTDTGDCADAGAFAIDGRFRLADGSRGMWNVREGRLVIQNAQGRNEVELRRVGEDEAQVVNADGSVGRSTRC